MAFNEILLPFYNLPYSQARYHIPRLPKVLTNPMPRNLSSVFIDYPHFKKKSLTTIQNMKTSIFKPFPHIYSSKWFVKDIPQTIIPIIKTLYYRTHSCVQHCPTSFTLIFFFAEVSMNSQLKCRARFIPWSLPTTLSSSRSLLFPTRIMGTCQTVHKTMVTNIHSFKYRTLY